MDGLRHALDRTKPMPTKQTASRTQDISLAHSPDSDDAFMFYALATGKVRTPGLKFTHKLSDIETLNQEAKKEKYDVTAVSFYASAFLQKNYVLLDCGASFPGCVWPSPECGRRRTWH
jgi:1,4-dihydroxy-6-naphthoate synthase